MKTCPADEQRISEVERGQSREAVVPLPPGESLGVGDTVLFALSRSRAGQQPSYVKGGDSVLVSLTEVVDLGSIDPISGQALYRLRWEPLGQNGPPDASSGRAAKADGSRAKS